MVTTTPLLFLLDGILSQEDARVDSAMIRIAEMLRKAGVSLRLPQPEESPLRSALNLVTVIQLLISAYPDLTAIPSGHDGSLPLHFAASVGDVQVASLLLTQNPQAASTPNSKGKIPLHYAAREGRIEMVNFFMRAVPHTAAFASKKQKLAIHFAAGDGHVAVVQSLLSVYPQGASMTSAKGKLPLHFAARWGHIQIAHDLLYVHPEGIKALDWEGSLPLHDAAREGQYAMARYLVERYPEGLLTANIRGEVPLFPAVRSGNVDLVVLLLQAWPVGGKHILKNLSADDVGEWDWEILELLLRGAVCNFAGCSIIEGKYPPSVRLMEDPSSDCSSMDCCKERLNEVDTGIEPAERNLPTFRVLSPPVERMASPAMETTSSNSTEAAMLDSGIPRSKSPILEGEGSRKKRASDHGSGERKRARRTDPSGHERSLKPCRRSRLFIPLHAALQCGASCHTLRYVLQRTPEDVRRADDMGRLPLHLAVARCNEEEEEIKLIVEEILKQYPQAASMRDEQNRLPLHIAVVSKADVGIISALLDAYPSAGFDACLTNDSWRERTPIQMACHYDCNLSTVYELLRVDPSFVQAKHKH